MKEISFRIYTLKLEPIPCIATESLGIQSCISVTCLGKLFFMLWWKLPDP